MSSQLKNTTDLIERLAQLYPHYGRAELLRMALLITLHPSDQTASEWNDALHNRDTESLVGDQQLLQHSRELSMQLSAAGDQHAAMTEQFDSLAADSPCEFSPEHLFALVRAIRVQGRMLNLYLGPAEAWC